MNLQNSTVLISGGSSGIGLAIGKTLAEAGARIAITGRDQERLTAAAQDLDALAIQADVTSEADVIRTYETVLGEFGKLDILVNNAGIGVFKPLVDMDRESFESVLTTNVTGAMLMGREAAKHFIAENGGNIVNVSSTAGLSGRPQRYGLYDQQVCASGDDRMLARGAASAQCPGVPCQPERSDHELRNKRGIRPEGQPHETACS